MHATPVLSGLNVHRRATPSVTPDDASGLTLILLPAFGSAATCPASKHSQLFSTLSLSLLRGLPTQFHRHLLLQQLSSTPHASADAYLAHLAFPLLVALGRTLSVGAASSPLFFQPSFRSSGVIHDKFSQAKHVAYRIEGRHRLPPAPLKVAYQASCSSQ